MQHATAIQKAGKVYLVGAGPGDPELLTVRGLRCLMQSEVVLYDRLVDARLLHYAPASARLVDVGKPPGHAASQCWIERLMIAEARKGRCVVRLKSGDPFVFGRGGEEAAALAQAGVDYEVVPGVSSAIAVPALAGIPVLHRQYASALAIVTGHRCSPPEITMWAAWLHQGGTLVILMGMSRLEQIVGALQQAGLPADVPIAVTMAGSTPQEKTVTGTLATIVEAARDLSAPAVLVLGRVVALREALLPVMPAAYVTSLRRV